ncbi:techylectin-5A-like [Drosophila innubila]|uniref:techylectin-5A-like n=1 Tax=Drosophila innubila TaxID=198719 RepID=UPI00148C2400|nr:techylectin-5A-like [Drosophila innubila]
MLFKIFGLFFIINTLFSLSEAIHLSEHNETNLFVSISSQLSKLRTELEHQGNFMDGLVKAMDLALLKAEQDRQGKLIDELVKDRQGKLIDGLVKATDIQFIREELEQLKKDTAVKDSDMKSLRAELERQNNDLLKKELDFQSLRTEIQSLRVELEDQKKGGIDKESDKYNLSPIPRICSEAKTSGIYNILLSNINSQPFKVACDAETRGGGWTIILRRMDGTVEFNRNWTEYQKGFGEVSGEFFLGLDKIHELTAERKQELLVILEDFEGVEKFETYDEFAIGDENQQYILHTLGVANGTAGDSFSKHMGKKFSTFDRDNDLHPEVHCANLLTGGWWYHDGCHWSKLTGIYKDYIWQRHQLVRFSWF